MTRMLGRFGAGLLAISLLSSQLDAYKLMGPKWSQPSTTFYADIPGSDGLWNRAFENAMGTWNSRTSFRYSSVRSFLDPCAARGTGQNGVTFSDTSCGEAFGNSTLAVTWSWYSGSTLQRTGVVFNSKRNWSVYDGPWSGTADFQRVAVHELGHALGLDHENSVPAIMNTSISWGSSISLPQPDDINGVNAIYGGSTTEPAPPPPPPPPPPPQPINRAPTVEAGADQVVKGGQSVILRGSASDPDNDLLTLSWTQVSGPFVAISGATQPTAGFVAPRLTQDSVFTFRLTASDGKGGTAADDVRVTVQRNNPPVVSAGSTQTVDSGAAVSLSGTATDPDGDPLSVQWTQSAGPSVALSDRNKTTAFFKAPQVGAETVLTFKLTVSDGLFTGEAGVNIVVRPVHTLLFPYSLSTGNVLFRDTFVGIALANLGATSSNATVTATDPTGAERNSVWLSPPIAARGQKTLVAAEIPAPGASTLVVRSSGTPLQGFFMIGDAALKRLDGVGGEIKSSRALYFPLARHGAGQATSIFLFNPNGQLDPNVSLRLFNRDGVLLRSRNVALLPGGSLVGTLDQIFGSDLVLSEGFIFALGTLPLKGFEFYARGGDLSSLTAQVAGPTTRLISPHFFASSDDGTTELRLLNAGSNKAFIKIKALDNQGTMFASADVAVQSNTLFTGDLKQLLRLDASLTRPAVTLTGYLVLDVTGERIGIFDKTPEVIGSIHFSGNVGKFLSSLPLLDRGMTDTAFLHVAQSRELRLFTGLAIYNPDTAAARVRVQAFNEAGMKTGEKEFDLPAGRRLVGLLNESTFFGSAFNQVKGHLRVTSLPTAARPSAVPVVAFALFGDESGEFLSAIEGQKPIN